MPIFHRLLLAAFAVVLGALPGESRAEDLIAGLYDVRGTNEGGGQYKGVAEIVANGDTYEIYWKIGNGAYGGRGVATKNGLAFAFIGGGFKGANVVLYERVAPGVWCGIWTTNRPGVVGQEALIRHSEESTAKVPDCTAISASRDGIDLLDRQVAWDQGDGNPELADKFGR
jgi:hypothetical protein